jgi:hypothetical protein
MAVCTTAFARSGRREIQVDFDGGDVSSDGGLLLLREVDRRLRLTERIAVALPDERAASRVRHSVHDMVRQRVYAIAQGHEDLNDHDSLRHDLLLQTAVERADSLASAPTLCRLENRIDRAAAVALHEVLVQTFINSHSAPPKELVLDIDATDDPVHGEQESRFFHGYYDQYCFLPLYVFCGEQLLVSYLRPSNIDAAKHGWAVLALLVKRLRRVWPQVEITIRADSGFCRWRLLRWCDRHGVGYVIGVAKNERLLAATAGARENLVQRFEKYGTKQRELIDLWYGARTWDCERRVVARLEYTAQGDNPRFVVTNLNCDAATIYDTIYCARGEAENRIKEAQLGLFADRTSCHAFKANQFRLLLSSAAYVLVQQLRALALAGTEFARLQATTLRAKLLKIGAVIVRSTRRVRVMLSSSFPHQDVFLQAVNTLASP